MNAFTTTLIREVNGDEIELEVEVEYEVTAGYRGTRDDPPEPSEVNIIAVTCDTGEVDLSDTERDILQEKAEQSAADDFEDPDEPDDVDDSRIDF